MKLSITMGLLLQLGAGSAFASTTYTVTNLNQGLNCSLAPNGNVACNTGVSVQQYNYGTGTTNTAAFGYGFNPIYTNAGGQVAGNNSATNSIDLFPVGTPTFFNGASTVALPLPNGYTSAQVSGIDGNGDVVGTLGTSPSQGIIWKTNGSSITYTVINGPNYSGDLYISPNGTVAYNTAAGDFIYNIGAQSSTQVDNLGAVILRGVSDTGVVVGYNYNGAIYQAYEASASGGVVQICPSLSNCSGATTNQGPALVADNAGGQAVGTAQLPSPSFQTDAFLYSGGQLQDLNSLLASDLNAVLGGSGWYLHNATAINNAGQILASAYNGSAFQDVLLTPVTSATPEPGTLGLVAIGGTLAYFASRRQRRESSNWKGTK